MIDVEIKGLTADSRQVCAGDVFVALPGHLTDGRKYVTQAIQQGAVAILSEAADGFKMQESVPVVEYSNLSEALGFMASCFFSKPSHTMPVIGITGTNGKTSCTHFIAQLLNAWFKNCGIIGTLGVGFLQNLEQTHCTTPDAISVHRHLACLRDQKASLVAMEVSSHALEQNRVNGVRFKTAIFTNFTQDHLDYHGNMTNYWCAKKRLFLEQNVEYVVINLEDPKAEELLKALVEKQNVSLDKIIGYTTIEQSLIDKSLLSKIMVIQATNVLLDKQGITASIQTPWGKGSLQSSLLGRFNLSNILAALIAVCIEGMPLQSALNTIKNLNTVPGRMMSIHRSNQPRVVVDYAHTPDALKQVLTALRSHAPAKLWCVFGCGGDRDRLKRPLMTKVVEDLSDHMIMTLDNPRTEAHHQIFNDMQKGLNNPEKAMIQPNRILAIRETIEKAGPLDIILIAGKGHETMQIMHTHAEPLDDYQEAIKALDRLQTLEREGKLA